jgi:hypothetical protein
MHIFLHTLKTTCRSQKTLKSSILLIGQILVGSNSDRFTIKFRIQISHSSHTRVSFCNWRIFILIKMIACFEFLIWVWTEIFAESEQAEGLHRLQINKTKAVSYGVQVAVSMYSLSCLRAGEPTGFVPGSPPGY